MNFLSLLNSNRAVAVLVLILCSALPLGAETWIQTSAPFTNWSGLTSSADGSKLAATVSNGPIYISTNSGHSWFETGAPIEPWESIASSADGRVLAACAVHWGDPATGAVYISTNTGATWIRSTIPEDVQWPLAVSADGSRIAGCWSPMYPTQEGRMYLSADSGASWTTRPGEYLIRCITFSADGMTLAVSGGGSITVSTNFGDTWNQAAGGKFSSVALSSDASTMLVAGFPMWDFGLHLSTNAGLTWATANLPMNYWYPAVSADGRKFVAAGIMDGLGLALYTSADAGATWVEGPRGPANTLSFSASADASRIAVAGYGTGIYILHNTPKPRLEIAPCATAVKLSWVVPSQPFTLQQSPSPAVGNWQDVGQEPALNYSNLHHEVTVSPGAGPMFYRLVSR